MNLLAATELWPQKKRGKNQGFLANPVTNQKVVSLSSQSFMNCKMYKNSLKKPKEIIFPETFRKYWGVCAGGFFFFLLPLPS